MRQTKNQAAHHQLLRPLLMGGGIGGGTVLPAAGARLEEAP
jgi:hypothetical protein